MCKQDIFKLKFFSNNIYCLIGNPVSHSLSPLIHNSLFNYFGYNGIYLTFLVNDIALSVDGIRGLGIKGCSITSPYKISIMKHLDCINDIAKIIGSVNTVVNKNGILTGYNFDYSGAMSALLEKHVIKNQKVVLVGAGGSARAIGYGIKNNGGELTIINRDEKKGRDLASILDADFCTIFDILNVRANILINTVPVDIPILEMILNPSMVVMDIVYGNGSFETKLLKLAKKIGCSTINGLSMLAYQGLFQFKIWTNLKPSIEFIKKTLEKYLT